MTGRSETRRIAASEARRELSTLARILAQEQRNGCPDRVVVGGLAGFLAGWRQRVLRADPALAATVEAIAAALHNYRQLAPPERAAAVGRALALLVADAPTAVPAVALPPQPGAPDQAGPDRAAAGRSPISTRPAEAARLQWSLAASRSEATSANAMPPPDDPLLPPAGSPLAGSRRPARSSQAGAVPALDRKVSAWPGIGPRRAAQLARLGITTVEDLLAHLPTRHEPYPPPRRAGELFFQKLASYEGVVREIEVQRTTRGPLRITATLADETGAVLATWFRGYARLGFQRGDRIAVSGPLSSFGRHLTFENPEWEHTRGPAIHTRRLVPIYPQTEGVTSRWLRELVWQVLEQRGSEIDEPLPAELRERHGLMPRPVAIAQAHFPTSPEHLARAQRRLAFDELLAIQLTVLRRRAEWQRCGAVPLHPRPELLDAFRAGLPFPLTGAQVRVIGEIAADLAKSEPMTRLLQGEVGAGKTAVAAAALLFAVDAGGQGVLMAPTEILAEQHARTITRLYEAAAPALTPLLGRSPRVALLTGSRKPRERAAVYQGVADGSIDVLIGTQALIQEALEFRRLLLAIVDEQHRFGVRQRLLLREKGGRPHLLVMTATPIPRTLALTAYGDLDLSLLDELPPGRQPVRTYVVGPRERDLAYEKIRREVRKGRQAFLICPLVEGSDGMEAKAATEEYERLRRGELADLRLALLHGRMRAAEKDRIMREFRDGKYDVLVATSVVEVGVDVPNATVIAIEGAERFGLAQLHQFRGRVGRGEHPATCLLLSDSASEEARARLELVARSPSGLALAEEDLRLRGPGEYFGLQQSGFPDLKVARLTDAPLVAEARQVANEILARDPDLAAPEHAGLARLASRFAARAGDAN